MAEGVTRKTRRKERSGRVVSDAMDKTIVVELRDKRPHPFYRKLVRYTKKLYAHDEKNEAKTGDIVNVEETRPLSRKKRWRLVGIVSRTVSGPEKLNVDGS